MMDGKQIKSEKDFDTFFLAFSGQQVTITTSTSANMTVQDEHSHVMNSIPLYYEGVLMDYDQNYYYLGNGKEVDQAVKITSVIHIMVSQKPTVYDELLNKMPLPYDDNGVN